MPDFHDGSRVSASQRALDETDRRPSSIFRIPAKNRFVDHLTISKKTISELSCSLIVNTPPSLIVRQIVHY